MDEATRYRYPCPCEGEERRGGGREDGIGETEESAWGCWKEKNCEGLGARWQ